MFVSSLLACENEMSECSMSCACRTEESLTAGVIFRRGVDKLSTLACLSCRGVKSPSLTSVHLLSSLLNSLKPDAAG